MKLLIFILVGFLTSSCSIKSGDSKKNADRNSDESSKPVVVTDLSLCDSGSPPNDPRGSWTQKLKNMQDGLPIYFDVKLNFTGNQFQTSNTCTFQGQSLTTRVTAAANFDYRRINILEKKDDEKNYDDGKIKFQCSINIDPITMDYNFRGSCLVLHVPNQDDLIFLPFL